MHSVDGAQRSRTGECVRTSTSRDVAGRRLTERSVSQGGAAAGLATAVVQRNSAQPTRRAVLCAQAPGDPVAPADLASWFTERAFHFYVAGCELPATAALTGRRARHDLVPAFADLDAACRRLREADGMASVIVTAHGRAAVAAALWSDSRQQVGDGQPGGSARADGRAAAGERSDQSGADALILSAPAWPTGQPAPAHRVPGAGPCRPECGADGIAAVAAPVARPRGALRCSSAAM